MKTLCLLSLLVIISLSLQCQTKPKKEQKPLAYEIIEKSIEKKCDDEPEEWTLNLEEWVLGADKITKEVIICWEAHRMQGFFEIFGNATFEATQFYVQKEGYDMDKFTHEIQEAINHATPIIKAIDSELLDRSYFLHKVTYFAKNPTFDGYQIQIRVREPVKPFEVQGKTYDNISYLPGMV